MGNRNLSDLRKDNRRTLNSYIKKLRALAREILYYF